MDFVIRRELEGVVKCSSPKVFDSYDNFSRFILRFSWYVSKIPVIMAQPAFKILRIVESQVLDIEEHFLIFVQASIQSIIYLGYLEVFPEGCHTQNIIPDINDFHLRIISLRLDSHYCFFIGIEWLCLHRDFLRRPILRIDNQLQIKICDFNRREGDWEVDFSIGWNNSSFEVKLERVTDLLFSLFIFLTPVLQACIDIKSTVWFIFNPHCHLLIFSDLYSSKVDRLFRNLYATVWSFPNYFNIKLSFVGFWSLFLLGTRSWTIVAHIQVEFWGNFTNLNGHLKLVFLFQTGGEVSIYLKYLIREQLLLRRIKIEFILIFFRNIYSVHNISLWNIFQTHRFLGVDSDWSWSKEEFPLILDLDFGARANAQKGNFYIWCSWHIIQSNVESWFVCLVIFWGELKGHNAETFGLD